MVSSNKMAVLDENGYIYLGTINADNVTIGTGLHIVDATGFEVVDNGTKIVVYIQKTTGE
jgi:hypothetical protein